MEQQKTEVTHKTHLDQAVVVNRMEFEQLYSQVKHSNPAIIESVISDKVKGYISPLTKIIISETNAPSVSNNNTTFINKTHSHTAIEDHTNDSRNTLSSLDIHYEEGKTMNDEGLNTTLFKEIKDDLREREERQRREISERENRFERQLSQYASDAKEREDRIVAMIKEHNEKIDSYTTQITSKLDEEVREMRTLRSQNFYGNLTIFIGMLAVVITLIIFALSQ